jgi:hypothetical protein
MLSLAVVVVGGSRGMVEREEAKEEGGREGKE